MYIPIGAAKIVLFLHIRKKKVQFVARTALFYLEVRPLRCWKLEVRSKESRAGMRGA